MENTADWRTESRTVYSDDFKLRIVEHVPDANVAKIARKMVLLTISFFSGCACGKTRGGYPSAIQTMLKRPGASGLSRPQPEGMTELRLASLLHPESDSRPGAQGILHMYQPLHGVTSVSSPMINTDHLKTINGTVGHDAGIW